MGRKVDPRRVAIRRVLAGRFQQKRASVDFWKVVDQGGWGHKSTDPNKVKDVLLGLMNQAEAKRFDAQFGKLRRDLQRRINRWENLEDKSLGVSDDGFDDLTSHIVGMGRKEYGAVMGDPELAWERAHAPYGSKDGYKESFAYAIPDEDDYKVDLSHYKKWAEKAMDEYAVAAKEPSLRFLRYDLARIGVILSIMVEGDYNSFLGMAAQAKKTSEDIEEAYNKAVSEGKYKYWETNQAVPNKWLVWNLLSDLHKFLSRRNLIRRTASVSKGGATPYAIPKIMPLHRRDKDKFYKALIDYAIAKKGPEVLRQIGGEADDFGQGPILIAYEGLEGGYGGSPKYLRAVGLSFNDERSAVKAAKALMSFSGMPPLGVYVERGSTWSYGGQTHGQIQGVRRIWPKPEPLPETHGGFQIRRKKVDVALGDKFVWVSGSTYSIKENLKSLGFRWDQGRKSWSLPRNRYNASVEKELRSL